MFVLEGGTSIKKDSLTVWRQTVLLRCQPRSSSPSPSPQSSSSPHRLGEASKSCFKWFGKFANPRNPCSHMSRDTPFNHQWLLSWTEQGSLPQISSNTQTNNSKQLKKKVLAWNGISLKKHKKKTLTFYIQYCFTKNGRSNYIVFSKWMFSACRPLRSCR